MKTAMMILICASMAALASCGGSAWEAAFEPGAEVAAPRREDDPVTLREVPWERLDATLDQLNQARIRSDIHPDEWTPAQKDDAHATLLRGLQVSSDPATVGVLGRSSFKSTARVRPNDGELTAFARKIGATMVVWSVSYVGKADVIEKEPVTGWTSGSERYRDRDGKRRTDSYSQDSTVWVPVKVQKDEYAWVAYYLREAALE